MLLNLQEGANGSHTGSNAKTIGKSAAKGSSSNLVGKFTPASKPGSRVNMIDNKSALLAGSSAKKAEGLMISEPFEETAS